MYLTFRIQGEIWNVETCLGCKAEDNGFIFPLNKFIYIPECLNGNSESCPRSKALFLSGGKGDNVYFST